MTRDVKFELSSARYETGFALHVRWIGLDPNGSCGYGMVHHLLTGSALSLPSSQFTYCHFATFAATERVSNKDLRSKSAPQATSHCRSCQGALLKYSAFFSQVTALCPTKSGAVLEIQVEAHL